VDIRVVERAVTAVSQQRSQRFHGIRIRILGSLQKVSEREQVGADDGYPPAQQDLASPSERISVDNAICGPAQPSSDGQAVASAEKHVVL
jgi:hypothetical protein